MFQNFVGFPNVVSVCLDVDECTAFFPVCHVNANCRNTRGSYSCTCNSGFSGDGKTCRGEDRTNSKVVQ